MNPPILAFFRNDADERRWKSELASIPGIISIVTGESAHSLVKTACRTVPKPQFVLLSASFYPDKGLGVTTLVRNLLPGTEILLVSPASEPFPDVGLLFRDGIRNLVVAPSSPLSQGSGPAESPLRIAVASLTAERRERMSACLRRGATVSEFTLTSSDQKEVFIKHLESTVTGKSSEAEFLRQRAALIADEMIENALYGAPRDRDGARIFRKGERREILPGERIGVRFGFDGENLAIEVSDGWGSLRPEEIIEHLEKNRDRDGLPPTDGGLGLFLIWRFVDHLYVSIAPGRETVVSGHVRLATPGELPEAKGFHMEALRACA
ncbi:MAG: ATP-binding protein [Desulfuromonadales bacterium]|nr:MAG: ATP-binding protein [Desulfuromonadales bacterium]